MRAVRIHEYGGPEVLKYETDVPEPALARDTVLIAAAAASVNPIDWKVRSGARQKDFPLELPAILGRDVAGTVKAVGADVRGFKPGDRVLAMTYETYAELVAVPEAQVAPMPDGLDLIDAAAVPLIALTGAQLVRVAAGVEPGQTVIVGGALGSVGRAAVHAAQKLGATVIAGVRARQLAEAEALGAAAVVAVDDDAALAALDPVDVVADTIGGETGVKLLGKVKRGGRFGYASFLPEDAGRDASVTVTRVYGKPDPAIVSEFARDFRDGTFVLPISRRLPLTDVASAHATLEQGGGGKIVLTI